MNITPTTTTNNNNTTTTITPNPKSPEADGEIPTRIQHTKPLPLGNGVLKRHKSHHHNPVVVSYKECLKNHAASLGGHALDGCGEFMPSHAATTTDPTSLKCAACGCHRNFHRREPEKPNLLASNTNHLIEYQPYHRHHPLPPLQGNRSPNSASPPPISSSYYPSSAPHMLLALSTGLSAPHKENNVSNSGVGIGNPTKKRFRTKFSPEQREKMYQFAEKVGWKIQKRDEDTVHAFCNEVGVDKGVLKVWMHNNKSTVGKKEVNGCSGTNSVLEQITQNNGSSSTSKNNVENENGNGNGNNAHNEDEHEIQNQNHYQQGIVWEHHEATTNGSSSSS